MNEQAFHALAERVRNAPAAATTPAALAAAAGLTGTGLAELVREHAHMTPAAWLVRERIAAACKTLLGGRGSIHRAAERAGFTSDAAFRRSFLAVARMTPEAYRALPRRPVFELRVPARYRAAEVLAYHARDPQSPCERVMGRKVLKAMTAPEGPLVLEIALERSRAECRIHAERPLAPTSLRAVHRKAVRMLGLTADVGAFETLARRDGRLAPIVARRPGLRLPLTSNVFEALCWAIIGQQINLAFASALRREVLALAGTPVDGMTAHPSPERLAEIDVSALTRRRFSRSKAEYLLDTARAVATGALDPETFPTESAVTTERAMTQLRGIGTWTARYVLMRGAGFADCAPVGDVALANALARAAGASERPGPADVDALMRPFAPHRSLATFHLWASLKD